MPASQSLVFLLRLLYHQMVYLAVILWYFSKIGPNSLPTAHTCTITPYICDFSEYYSPFFLYPYYIIIPKCILLLFILAQYAQPVCRNEGYYERFGLSKRILQLRMNMGVSARDMSLTLGLSEGYVNKLENGKTLPSMKTFFTICDYFEITPQEFFDTGAAFPLEIKIAVQELSKMSMVQLERLVGIMKDMNQGK